MKDRIEPVEHITYPTNISAVRELLLPAVIETMKVFRVCNDTEPIPVPGMENFSCAITFAKKIVVFWILKNGLPVTTNICCYTSDGKDELIQCVRELLLDSKFIEPIPFKEPTMDRCLYTLISNHDSIINLMRGTSPEEMAMICDVALAIYDAIQRGIKKQKDPSIIDPVEIITLPNNTQRVHENLCLNMIDDMSDFRVNKNTFKIPIPKMDGFTCDITFGEGEFGAFQIYKQQQLIQSNICNYYAENKNATIYIVRHLLSQFNITTFRLPIMDRFVYTFATKYRKIQNLVSESEYAQLDKIIPVIYDALQRGIEKAKKI